VAHSGRVSTLGEKPVFAKEGPTAITMNSTWSPAHNQPLEEIDRQTVLHPNTDLRRFASEELGDPTIVSGADGIRIRDQHGREFIDAFASLWCVNIGYGRKEIAETLRDQALKMAYYHSHAGHSSEPVIRLTDRVLRLAPHGMSRVF